MIVAAENILKMAARGVVQSVEGCKELWYTNMLLLGFRPSEREEQFKVERSH